MLHTRGSNACNIGGAQGHIPTEHHITVQAHFIVG
jgi:hypothetical protein